MARILAIDYGLKRTGIAVTNESQTIAFGLETVATVSLQVFLKNYCENHKIAGFVVGEPKTLLNEPTDATAHVEGFIRRLQKDYPLIPVYRMDERFTSKMASRSLIESGVKKEERKNKGLVDMVSATIILQSWLEQQLLRNQN